MNESCGIVAAACEAAGISRGTFYRWCREDPEFKEQVDAVQETQIDYVESKLLKNITAGDTTAIIFYLKTKGKSRGYSNKDKPEKETPQKAALPEPTAAGLNGKITPALSKRLRDKKAYLIKLKKEQGTYTPDLSFQAEVVAQLLVRTELLRVEVFGKGHKPLRVQYSREGNERVSVDPTERLYLEFLQRSQRALQAFGLNVDAKEHKPQDDGLNDFLAEFKDEAE